MESRPINSLRDFFQNQNVLVTGHTGFKGSWLALWLHQLGAKVTGFSLPPESDPSHFNLLNLKNVINHIEGDLRVQAAIEKCIQETKPSCVFHLAAQALVRRSYQDPRSTFSTNIMGGINLLEALKQSDTIKSLVYITSDKAYYNQEWAWGYRENDRLGGHDPYSASKAASELVFSSYSSSFFDDMQDFGAATARAGNVIGGGDWSPDRIIPDCIRALEKKTDILVRNPGATRPWQHVLDPLFGYLKLAKALAMEPLKFQGAWNFGPETGDALSVSEVTKRVIKYWGSGKFKVTKKPGPFEHQLLQLSIEKAKLNLGWKPRWNSERAIKETVHWYRSIANEKKAMDVSCSQICAFEEAGCD